MSHDQDWRLQLDLEQPADLERLVGRVRSPDGFEQDERASLGDEVVLTHDGTRFFAYAMNERALSDAREATEEVLKRDGLRGTISLSHWEEDCHEWRQTDPPAEQSQAHEPVTAKQRHASATSSSETRPVVCVIGRLIRKPFERQMLNYASELGLRCEIVEHPHLLSTQVAFNVSGPHSKIDAFADYLRSEANATTRLDPGLVPFGLP